MINVLFFGSWLFDASQNMSSGSKSPSSSSKLSTCNTPPRREQRVTSDAHNGKGTQGSDNLAYVIIVVGDFRGRRGLVAVQRIRGSVGSGGLRCRVCRRGQRSGRGKRCLWCRGRGRGSEKRRCGGERRRRRTLQRRQGLQGGVAGRGCRCLCLCRCRCICLCLCLYLLRRRRCTLR